MGSDQNQQSIARFVEQNFGIRPTSINKLNTLVNDVYEVHSSSGRFALKLYLPAWRQKTAVSWEIELINHMLQHQIPVSRPISGHSGFLETWIDGDSERAAAMFEWLPGSKPTAESSTYLLLGDLAARIHMAADSFQMQNQDRLLDLNALVHHPLSRMRVMLERLGEWQQVARFAERLCDRLGSMSLDFGVCHMDLTLDNVHRDGDHMGVFDFDSAGYCWRAFEPTGVLLGSDRYFQDWLTGYRQHRNFSAEDETAVRLFTAVSEIENTAWKLGLAKSSRGEPLMVAEELPATVNSWLEWERHHL